MVQYVQGSLGVKMQRPYSRLMPVFLKFPRLSFPPRHPLNVPRRLPFPLLQPQCGVQLLTRLKFVDNSENAKKVTKLDRPYCIKTPKNSKSAGFGDIITIAHRGRVHKALIVSNRRTSKRLPRYDTSNIILLDDKLEPVGTRIIGPLPSAIRSKERKFSKVIAIASKFI